MTSVGLVEVQSSLLTVAEQSDLATHEATIARGLQTFYDVGAALLAIREQRLYRDSHGTFEDYCRERWGMSRVRAHQFIDASNVVDNLLTIVNKPSNEAQARELAALAPEAQVQAWAATTELLANEPITAARIRDVVEVAKEAIADGVPTEQLREAIKERVVHVSHNSGNNEWYTPPQYIEAARAVMGGIDCDPASSEIANRNVKATKFYTAEDDGLTQPTWGNRVWMNPPYSTSLIGQFVDEIVRRFESGEVQEACVLVNNATETAWFQALSKSASAVCLLRGRVKYLDATGQPANTPLQGQAVLYLGSDSASFGEEFGDHGTVFYAGR